MKGGGVDYKKGKIASQGEITLGTPLFGGSIHSCTPRIGHHMKPQSPITKPTKTHNDAQDGKPQKKNPKKSPGQCETDPNATLVRDITGLYSKGEHSLYTPYVTQAEEENNTCPSFLLSHNKKLINMQITWYAKSRKESKPFCRCLALDGSRIGDYIFPHIYIYIYNRIRPHLNRI